MKENAGGAARAQLHRRLTQVGAVLLLILWALYFVASASTSSRLSSTTKNDDDAAARRSNISLRGIKNTANDKALPPIFQQSSRRRVYQRWKQRHGEKDDTALILSGEANLVDIVIHRDAFFVDDTDSDGGGGRYNYKVTGVFCHVDFYLHKADPSVVPMFRDLVGQSAHCKGSGKIRTDLNTMVQKAREYDERDGAITHAIPPTGFVFHESRCGSTLVANSLMAMEPDANRVYSESSPPLNAAQAVSRNKVPKHDGRAIQLLRDVVYMMGRTNDVNEKRLFFKVQSIGVKSIQAFQRAFPTTPWIFAHRDPVQVMMSHLKDKGRTKAVCTRSRSAPPKDLVDLVKTYDASAKVSRLSVEDYCAAHLATLCEAAYSAYERSEGRGKIVDYKDLPDALIEDIIPNHFAQPIDDEAIARILKASQSYSKARTVGASWVEDSDRKDKAARPEIRSASDKYLLPVFERLKNT
mmetsp:Transcript_25953/g.56258  ORF Transcript_25953/g.56258 Transcript_25953/m.56258 type:complete len:468 (+) Transcript_25953:47-1450(+)